MKKEIQGTEQMETNAGKDTVMREKITIAFASVIEALFLLLEIYFMIHSQGNFPILMIVAICMVAVLFFLVLSIIELHQKNKERERQEYADIYKAQKASYLAQKKYFDEINDRLSQLELNSTFPAEDIITAQKAVAKVTISRSKENADALMNANDQLVQRVFGFEEKLADNNDALLRQQQTIMQQTREEILSNNREMQEQFDLMYAALQQMNRQINDGSVSFENRMPETNVQKEAPSMDLMADAMTEEVPAMEETMVQQNASDDKEDVSQDELDAMLASLAMDTQEMQQELEREFAEELPDLDMVEETAEELPDLDMVEETAEELPSLDMVEETAEELPDLDMVEETAEELPDLDMVEEIAEELPNLDLMEGATEDLPKIDGLDDLPDIENFVDESEELPDLQSYTADVSEEKPQEIPEVEEVVMPDLSDSNKMMSPEEIAALFASV